MREQDYCITKFQHNFNAFKERTIALYGDKESIYKIIKSFSEYQFVCIINDNVELDLEEWEVTAFPKILDLDIKDILITEPTKRAELLYNEIADVCRLNNINVYNLYGRNMFELRNDASIKNAEYKNLKHNDIIKAIDAHDIISFDLDNTVFGCRYTDITDFEIELEKLLHQAGIELYCITEKTRNMREVDPYISLQKVLENMLKDFNLEGDFAEQIQNVILLIVKKSFVPRKSVIEAIKYATSQGKKVCFLEDMHQYRIPVWCWEQLMQQYGVHAEGDVISSTEYRQGKYDGLFRIVHEKYGKAKYLHIGDELEADIIVPQLYDMDTFLVKSPKELYNLLGENGIEMPKGKRIRDLWEKHVLAIYTDNYIIEKIIESKEQEKNSAFRLADKIRFYQNHNEIDADEIIEYEPILLDYVSKEISFENYPKLQFTEMYEPLVSIIIPVYNQFEYTYNCLHAILKHTPEIRYEVIIADDCSTDWIKDLEKIVYGITVLHNKENLRFLLNCNNAARYARGRYILFLNNDTQVQPNWLSPLVELMEQHSDAGMIGSKLVYPDGHLQEAGGILWKDGSAWNYGHLKNPEDPEVIYVKETDYISGAAIMIRTSLWNEIGGFDTTFAPAYYEDTDLAFEVRKHGYKVYFQPASLVVHFEGISNGTDTSEGLKSYQLMNQKKFFQKWKDVLGKEHFENGTNVYLAKDRGQKKIQILVVDHYVPNFDKDAGGRCTFMYIKSFLRMGMKVTFIGDNFAKIEPYLTVLNQLGVEVLCGDYYCLNWEQWLKDNLKYFDYVYLQRPHISIKYMDIVKEYGHAKIFYFAHDLHYIRMYRDYLISGNEESLKDSEHWKKIEMELFDKTDVGHVVGCYEQKVIQEAFPDKPIRNIPLYIYDQMPEQIEKDFSKRYDIMFVGGFSHAPNIDAVMWFAKNIFPKILEKHPDMVWHIVGSKAPQEILELANDNIILDGFLSDEALESLYRKCRLVVVPLRYGAGVKGKVVESAYYQIPVITTAIGGEGIDETVGSFVMEDDEDKIAALINHLYTDYRQLEKMSDAGSELIQKYFTSEAAENALLQDMNIRS